MIEHKHRALLEVKTNADKPGWFKALVAAFGNVDDGGDRIVKGAFAADVEARGGVYPVVWSHDWDTVPIGKTHSAVETDRGLEVEGTLLIDDNAKAREVWAAFTSGVPLEFSFAYEVTEARFVEEEGKTIRELLGLKSFEVGPTLVGMNRETELLAAKAAVDDPSGYLAAMQAASATFIASHSQPTATTPPPAPDPDPDERQGEVVPVGAARAEAVRFLATPA